MRWQVLRTFTYVPFSELDHDLFSLPLTVDVSERDIGTMTTHLWSHTFRIISPLMTIITPKYVVTSNCVQCFHILKMFCFALNMLYSMSNIEYIQRMVYSIKICQKPVCLLQLHLWRMSTDGTTTNLVQLFYDISFIVTSSSPLLCLLISNVILPSLFAQQQFFNAENPLF